MKDLNLKRSFLKFLRENPFPILGSIWLCFVILGLAAVGIFLPHEAKNNALVQGITTASAAEESPTNPRMATVSFADTVERVTPAVVTVRSEKKVSAQQQMPMMNEPFFQQFFGGRMPQMRQQPQKESALGSGVIVETDGTILTNNHVVAGADKVKVELTDKRTFDAKIVGTDESSDLAVLKIDATNLPSLPLADSDRVRVGDVVLAIGNPLGLQQTVTSGIISAKGRSTGLSDGSFEDFLQTDAPINHGNSGGALVSANGELIGINSQILSPNGGGNIGIGFAIPSNMARGVMSQLLKDGKVHRGMLGIGIQNITSDLATTLGLKEVRGVLVNSVTPGSPADKAGIKQGDVVLAINDTALNDGNELRNKVAQTAPGTEVNLRILRDGTEQNARVILAELKSKNNADDSEDSSNAPAKSGKLGLELQTITPEIASQLGLKGMTSGLVVADVEDGSPAEDAGIAPGDVILQINRQPVKSLNDVRTAVSASNGKPSLFYINRKGQGLFLTVQPQ